MTSPQRVPHKYSTCIRDYSMPLCHYLSTVCLVLYIFVNHFVTVAHMMIGIFTLYQTSYIAS